MDFESRPNQTDESLALLAKAGDDKALSALLERYRPLVQKIASRYYGFSLEQEDICQEGMLAVLSAVYSFLPERSASFKTYASVCVSNRLKTVVKQAASPKHAPLNTYIPLDTVEIVGNSDPEDKVISDEAAREIFRIFQNDLSKLERSVLKCFLKGYSYRETADLLHITEKAAGNALQRIRSKLKMAIHPNRS
ncbi:MAG: sigma-70 family RNA polymerase sigma factor [Clostridia bacterium]|nr:sigma-70 family RNA polymerase sigma factor [Clostridia bacterium]